MSIIKKDIIVEVNGIKLFDEFGGDMVVGFSDDGKEVYLKEIGDEGLAMPIKEVVKLKKK